tara:strand:+ start:987 stop:1118 length:132 start_codon:yes stop_codon:yes gene_type:complete
MNNGFSILSIKLILTPAVGFEPTYPFGSPLSRRVDSQIVQRWL